MKKINFKSFIIGFITCSIIMSSMIVFADTQKTQQIQAFFNDIKIKVNGEVVDTKNDEPFIVNSRTYVPARYVAEKLDATVKWNETDNTVEIDSVDNQQPVSTPIPKPTPKIISATEIVQTPTPTPLYTLKETDIQKDELDIFLINDIEYVRTRGIYDLFIKIKNDSFIWDYNDNTKILNLKYKDQILNNIPYINIGNITFISYDYYFKNVKPMLN